MQKFFLLDKLLLIISYINGEMINWYQNIMQMYLIWMSALSVETLIIDL